MAGGSAAGAFAFVVGVVFPASAAFVPAAMHDEKPTPAKVKELVARVFAAKPGDRDALVKELPKQFGAADTLTAADAKKWLPQIVEMMHAPVKGARKLAATGTNYLYDEKAKRGTYIVQGDARAKQLVICLHGGGEGEGSAESAVGGFGGVFHKMDKTVVIDPEVLEKTEHGWTDDETEQFILDLIETAKRTHPIDTNHVYVTGHSMGGLGTWTLGARYADLFGGLAAFAGAPTPYPNTFDVTGDATSKGLTLYLDARLVDLEKEAVVKVDGKEVFRKVVPIHLSTMVETAVERDDAEYVFGARVDL